MEQNDKTAVVSSPVQRNPSRTAVIALVVLLIVVAIAGIVLAGRRTAAPVPGTAAALPNPDLATSPVATPQETVAPTPKPNEVLFAVGSDRLPAEAGEQIANFADRARAAGGLVRTSAKFVNGPNKVRDLALSKSRAAAVRHALESNGIKSEVMQVEIIEMPLGTLHHSDGELVVMSLH